MYIQIIMIKWKLEYNKQKNKEKRNIICRNRLLKKYKATPQIKLNSQGQEHREEYTMLLIVAKKVNLQLK